MNQISQILQNIDVFEFEDRKNLQAIFLELHNNFPDVLETTLFPVKHQVVRTLIDKYNMTGMATFVGVVLRLFTKSSVSP